MYYNGINIRYLYIIGNGFDIHHEINCKYTDFRHWLEKTKPNIYSQLCELYQISIDKNEAKEWWSEFENMLSELDLNNYVENVVIGNYPDFSKEDLRDRDYHAAEYAAEDELGRFVYNVKHTFCCWIASLDKADSRKRIHLIRKDSLFITFNYTRTLEELYRIPENQVLHIHGMIGDDKLILGHGKSYTELEEIYEMAQPQPPADLEGKELENWYSSQSDYITLQTQKVALLQVASLQKDVQRIISENRLIWDSLGDVEKIHIFGFSFSDIDTPYLCTIINHINLGTVKWQISAFSDMDIEKIENFMANAGIKENLWKPLVTLRDIQPYTELSFFDDL